MEACRMGRMVFFSIGLGKGGVGSEGFWEGVSSVVVVVVCYFADCCKWVVIVYL